MNDLTLIVGGRKISGWTSVRVSRGIERLPSDFEVEMTELFPGEASAFVISPGDPCQVMLGADLVVTGYIDRVIPSIAPGSHAIRVSGRSKCADLVDCSAEWPGGQISGTSALDVAKKLAMPYGVATGAALNFPFPAQITVSSSADAGSPIRVIQLNLGETPYEIIERICRYSGLLVYDDAAGNLVLARAAGTKSSSGFTEGDNVQNASLCYASDQLFSQYDCYLQSVDTLSDVGDGGNLFSQVQDPFVKRYRKKSIIAESGDDGDFSVTKKRAMWEANRRFGRAFHLDLTTDGWRDKSGALYAPNTLVPLSLPSLKLIAATWLICDVTYRRDGQGGTTCDLVIMPAEAFDVQPIILHPTFHDVPVGPRQ